MPALLTRLSLGLLLAAAPAAAEGPVVVEVFTSQGCSSCPPVDALVGELAQRDDVLPLALHVDYWDYLGWKDSFADPAHTKRQKAYARAAQTGTIFTPEIVVAGDEHIVGFRPMDLAAAISGVEPGPVTVTAVERGGTLLVDAEAEWPGAYVVDLVRYVPEATVAVARGENAGRTLDYHNVVTAWRRLGAWDGRAPFRATAELNGEAQTAVLVQREDYGAIVGAARVP